MIWVFLLVAYLFGFMVAAFMTGWLTRIRMRRYQRIEIAAERIPVMWANYLNRPDTIGRVSMDECVRILENYLEYTEEKTWLTMTMAKKKSTS